MSESKASTADWSIAALPLVSSLSSLSVLLHVVLLVVVSTSRSSFSSSSSSSSLSVEEYKDDKEVAVASVRSLGSSFCFFKLGMCVSLIETLPPPSSPTLRARCPWRRLYNKSTPCTSIIIAFNSIVFLQSINEAMDCQVLYDIRLCCWFLISIWIYRLLLSCCATKAGNSNANSIERY